jgi:hypothetical protein
MVDASGYADQPLMVMKSIHNRNTKCRLDWIDECRNFLYLTGPDYIKTGLQVIDNAL